MDIEEKIRTRASQTSQSNKACRHASHEYSNKKIIAVEKKVQCKYFCQLFFRLRIRLMVPWVVEE